MCVFFSFRDVAWGCLGGATSDQGPKTPAPGTRSNEDCVEFKGRERKYTGAFSRWKQWADDQSGIQSFPVLPLHFTLYLQHLSDQAQSRAAVEEAINAVSWLIRQTISHDPFVKTVAAGLQRALAKPKKKKEPVTAAMLKDLQQGRRPVFQVQERSLWLL